MADDLLDEAIEEIERLVKDKDYAEADHLQKQVEDLLDIDYRKESETANTIFGLSHILKEDKIRLYRDAFGTDWYFKILKDLKENEQDAIEGGSTVFAVARSLCRLGLDITKEGMEILPHERQVTDNLLKAMMRSCKLGEDELRRRKVI